MTKREKYWLQTQQSQTQKIFVSQRYLFILWCNVSAVTKAQSNPHAKNRLSKFASLIRVALLFLLKDSARIVFGTFDCQGLSNK